MSLVRVVTKQSRELHKAFHCCDTFEGMCTEGRSIRQDTSLSARASFLSVLTRRTPTPKDFTRVAGTTRTWCPSCVAVSATAKASAEVSNTTRPAGRFFRYSPSRLVAHHCSSTTIPFSSQTQIRDFLPPRSIAIWSMAGPSPMRRRAREMCCGVNFHHRVRTGASHFIQSLSRRRDAADGIARNEGQHENELGEIGRE